MNDLLFVSFDAILSFLWDAILVWALFVLAVLIVVPCLKRIAFILFRRKERKFVMSYCNRNLKSNCTFLDHASGSYVLSRSEITVDPKKEFSCGEDVLKRIPIEEASRYYRFPDEVPTCYGVSFFSHNRLQDDYADEAHWFRVKLYRSDEITRSVLREWVRSSPKSEARLSQSVDINKMEPFVTGFRVAVNAFYERFGQTQILLSDSGTFFYDSEITPEVFNAKGDKDNFADRISEWCQGELSKKGLTGCGEVSFTDIGFDSENMCIILIGSVRASYSKDYRSLHHKNVNDVFKKYESATKVSDYQSLFVYSWINLRTRIIYNKNKNKNKKD